MAGVEKTLFYNWNDVFKAIPPQLLFFFFLTAVVDPAWSQCPENKSDEPCNKFRTLLLVGTVSVQEYFTLTR